MAICICIYTYACINFHKYVYTHIRDVLEYVCVYMYIYTHTYI